MRWAAFLGICAAILVLVIVSLVTSAAGGPAPGTMDSVRANAGPCTTVGC